MAGLPSIFPATAKAQQKAFEAIFAARGASDSSARASALSQSILSYTFGGATSGKKRPGGPLSTSHTLFENEEKSMLDAFDKVERRRMCGEALERVDETMQLWERPSEVVGDLAEVHRAINEWLEAGQQREDHQIQVQALLIQLYDWLHNFLPSAAAPEESDEFAPRIVAVEAYARRTAEVHARRAAETAEARVAAVQAALSESPPRATLPGAKSPTSSSPQAQSSPKAMAGVRGLLGARHAEWQAEAAVAAAEQAEDEDEDLEPAEPPAEVAALLNARQAEGERLAEHLGAIFQAACMELQSRQSGAGTLATVDFDSPSKAPKAGAKPSKAAKAGVKVAIAKIQERKSTALKEKALAELEDAQLSLVEVQGRAAVERAILRAEFGALEDHEALGQREAMLAETRESLAKTREHQLRLDNPVLPQGPNEAELLLASRLAQLEAELMVERATVGARDTTVAEWETRFQVYSQERASMKRRAETAEAGCVDLADEVQTLKTALEAAAAAKLEAAEEPSGPSDESERRAAALTEREAAVTAREEAVNARELAVRRDAFALREAQRRLSPYAVSSEPSGTALPGWMFEPPAGPVAGAPQPTAEMEAMEAELARRLAELAEREAALAAEGSQVPSPSVDDESPSASPNPLPNYNGAVQLTKQTAMELNQRRHAVELAELELKDKERDLFEKLAALARRESAALQREERLSGAEAELARRLAELAEREAAAAKLEAELLEREAAAVAKEAGLNAREEAYRKLMSENEGRAQREALEMVNAAQAKQLEAEAALAAERAKAERLRAKLRALREPMTTVRLELERLRRESIEALASAQSFALAALSQLELAAKAHAAQLEAQLVALRERTSALEADLAAAEAAKQAALDAAAAALAQLEAVRCELEAVRGELEAFKQAPAKQSGNNPFQAGVELSTAEPARLAPGAPSAAAPKNRGSRTTPANPNLTRTGKRTAEVDAMADAFGSGQNDGEKVKALQAEIEALRREIEELQRELNEERQAYSELEGDLERVQQELEEQRRKHKQESFDALAAALERESGSATAALVAAIEREAVSAAAEVAKIESLSFEIGDLERELRRAEAEAAAALAAVSAASRAVTAPSSLASGAAFAAAPLASAPAPEADEVDPPSYGVCFPLESAPALAPAPEAVGEAAREAARVDATDSHRPTHTAPIAPTHTALLEPTHTDRLSNDAASAEAWASAESRRLLLEGVVASRLLSLELREGEALATTLGRELKMARQSALAEADRLRATEQAALRALKKSEAARMAVEAAEAERLRKLKAAEDEANAMLSPKDKARIDKLVKDYMHPSTRIPAGVKHQLHHKVHPLSHSELPQMDQAGIQAALKTPLHPDELYQQSFLAQYVNRERSQKRAYSNEPGGDGGGGSGGGDGEYARGATAPAAAARSIPRGRSYIVDTPADALPHERYPDASPSGTGGIATHTAQGSALGAALSGRGPNASGSGTCSAVLVGRPPEGYPDARRTMSSTTQLERARWSERAQSPRLVPMPPPPSRETLMMRSVVRPHIIDSGVLYDPGSTGSGEESARASSSHEFRIKALRNDRPTSPRYLLTPVAPPGDPLRPLALPNAELRSGVHLSSYERLHRGTRGAKTAR